MCCSSEHLLSQSTRMSAAVANVPLARDSSPQLTTGTEDISVRQLAMSAPRRAPWSPQFLALSACVHARRARYYQKD
jgi:hypothetical protein